MLSPAIYSSDDSPASVFAVNASVNPSLLTHCATLIQSADVPYLRTGEKVTYRQLLSAMIEARKVIIL
jgi:hypothetical protein